MNIYTWNPNEIDALQINISRGDVDLEISNDHLIRLEVTSESRKPVSCKIVETEGDRLLRINMDHTGEEPFTLYLPPEKAWRVGVNVGRGDVSVTGLNIALTVEVGSGDINLETCHGWFDLRTGQGDVDLEDCIQVETEGKSGALLVRSGSGDVSIDNLDALACRVETGAGDISLDGGAVGQLVLNSGHGDVDCDGTLPCGNWKIDLKKGDISVVLPDDCSARLDAATRYGDIDSELPMVRVSRPGPEGRRGGRMVCSVGAAREEMPSIEISTNYGDISIEGPDSVTTPSDAFPEPAIVSETDRSPEEREAHQLKILDALSRGEIGVDEAEVLLRAF